MPKYKVVKFVTERFTIEVEAPDASEAEWAADQEDQEDWVKDNEYYDEEVESERVEEKSVDARRFNHCSIRPCYGERKWFFDCSMVSACTPVFDDCDSNYEVEDRLRKAGVITNRNCTDTESCALVLTFSSRKAGEKFIDRLNKYLEEHS